MSLVEKIQNLNLDTRQDVIDARREIFSFLRNKGKRDLITVLDDLENGRENEEGHDVEDILDSLEAYNREINSPVGLPKELNWDDIPDIKREWLIDRWLPSNTATLFTGQGGAGKSWLLLQASCQVALGYKNAFLDPDFSRVPENPQRTIVIATYEDEPEEIKRRLHALASDSAFPWIRDGLDTIKRNTKIVDMRGTGALWGPGTGTHISVVGDTLVAGEMLQAICKEQKASLLLVDPLSGAFGGNENDRTAVYAFLSAFREWADTVKCAVLLTGHLPKNIDARAAGFSGSTAWEAAVRSLWTLSEKSFKAKIENEETKRFYWTLQQTKSNYAKIQASKLLVKSKYGWWREAATIAKAAAGYDTYEASFDGFDDDYESEVTDGGSEEEDFEIDL